MFFIKDQLNYQIIIVSFNVLFFLWNSAADNTIFLTADNPSCSLYSTEIFMDVLLKTIVGF